MPVKKPTLLMILDGWGLREDKTNNAIKLAPTPNMDSLVTRYPFTSLSASGEDVGLPKGQMGNSEVGHLNMGSGRIVYQELTLISKSIEDKTFFDNKILINALDNAKKTNLHLIGLLSDGGVHSHIKHLFALLELAKKEGVKNVYIHAILDGRDTPPRSAENYVKELEDKINEIGIGEIATISGRYYAMDRDNRWERVEKAYDVLVYKKGASAKDALTAVKTSYENNLGDEFLIPCVIEKSSNKGIKKDDSIILFNFRSDRMRELVRALALKDFGAFDRKEANIVENCVCLTEYDATFDLPIAYPPQNLCNTLGEVLAKNNIHQLRTAETEKYAHVTFFFNGGVETPNEHEDRVLIPSPRVATYDLQPEMSAYIVTEKVLELINKDEYDVIIMNYANTDMVGHTGILEAAKKAVAAVDECVGKVIDKVLEKGGNAIITADHGNAEVMVDEKTQKPHTAHTTNRVPFILVSEKYKDISLKEGILADISPTILDILGIKKPKEMTGETLIIQ